MGLLAESSVDAVYTIFFVTLQECLSAHYGAEISLKICPPKKMSDSKYSALYSYVDESRVFNEIIMNCP